MFYINSVLFFSVLLLVSCDGNSDKTISDNQSSEGLHSFLKEVKSQLVFVEGGEYLMGDYGEEYGTEKLPYDSKKDGKPVHKVELSGFSISKFKTNNGLYSYYLLYNKLDNNKIEMGPTNIKYWREINSAPNTPAHVDWYDAEKYCKWLAEKTGLPFALPTEAQWEFAARNRGRFVIAPTDDGTIKILSGHGVNITTSDDREKYASENGTSLSYLSPMPGDARAPNPLGIYDMAGNGYEWMKDWYDPDYYKNSPVKDPQGPEQPTFKNYNGKNVKVMRSQDFSGARRGLTVVRNYEEPNNEGYIPADKTVRCVVNSPERLN